MNFKKEASALGKTSCNICLVGKIKEYFTKKIDTRATKRLERLYTNILGILLVLVRGY